jgi:pilus assembly protein FimV
LSKQLEKLLEQLQRSPNDVRLLQKIGELYQKLRNDKLASEYFFRVARQYAADGFFLKAISLAKQVHRLEETRTDCIELLVKWHRHLGLESEAREFERKLSPEIMSDG